MVALVVDDSRTPSKTVLITGAARRIGRKIALDLALDGWNVAVHYRSSKNEADDLVREINSLGVRGLPIQADLADASNVGAIVDSCREQLAAPTCLINNASQFQPDTLLSTTPESWHLHLDTNLKAPIFLAQAMAKALPDGIDGNVINIIDQRVWKPTPDFFSYTISKAGLWAATRTLAQSLAPRIRVNAIGPGPVLQSVHQTSAEFAQEIESTLLKRAPDAGEIAAAVKFILASPTLTGQMIALDSGQHLAWTPGQPAPLAKPGSDSAK